ncbi:MAG: DciA family protein [Candidatus Bipolaricaulota bacterium]|nr:DciA family protein [Candidatus Bipolaricaulota bacterium]MCS7274793.1 DciA family protein [Candidatus Bipolaricaulota bacterium]MDW8110072.1 DciA family protein [Candidatus Bipolaricaulota bacterium]MDW8329607.1 DciA family protein [Candidatus Bipolaricaulota bacterium]
MIEASLIEKIFRRHGLGEAYRHQEPALVWPQVVGAHIARLTKPLYVQNGVLVVAVTSHVFQHEFHLMRAEFRKKLNEHFGEERVRDVRFVVESPPKGEPPFSLEQIALTPHEEREIEQLVGQVESAELREDLKRLMSTAKRIERARRQRGWRPCPRCHTLCERDFCPLCAKEIV